MNQVFRSSFCVCLVLVSFGLAKTASAHEYYLMPEKFVVESGAELVVRHRLGQKFKGNELSWVGRWNIRSEVWNKGQKTEIKGIDGDRPALNFLAPKDGLQTIVHQSNLSYLDFKAWEKFTKYVTKEGMEYIIPLEEAKGKPKPTEDAPIRELYARFAKTLINVGDNTEGQDEATGLTIELVALENPAALDKNQSMPVQLLFRGRPLKDAMVKVFSKPNSEFSHRLITDEKGQVKIPADGPGPYLLNAIHMTEVAAKGDDANGADWQSFWASLTYERN